MKRRAPTDREALAAEVASLSKLGIDELRERWKAIYGKAPSREIGWSFLTRAIAYHLQERAYGGLKPSTRRLLARVTEETAAESLRKKPQIRKAQSGTVFHEALEVAQASCVWRIADSGEISNSPHTGSQFRSAPRVDGARRGFPNPARCVREVWLGLLQPSVATTSTPP